MRKLPRHPEQLGSLDLFADLDKADGSLSLQDVRRQQEVIARISRGLSKSLSNLSRTHGWRVQALFEAVAVDMEAVQLLKTEDAGDCFYDESSPVKMPDFRVVLVDGTILLVEVKNVPPGSLSTKMSVAELEALGRYADINNARLLVAHYWSATNLWTLIDQAVFERRAAAAHVSAQTALMANEMPSLGDFILCTRPPMVLRTLADLSKRRRLEKHREDFGSASFTIAEIELLVDGRRIVDRDEQSIAKAMMYFGGWEGSEVIQLDKKEEVLGADFVFRPADVAEAETESDIPERPVAPLSSIYSTQFNVATLAEDGTPSKLRLEPGGIPRLIPPGYWDRTHRLPLLPLQLVPSLGPSADAETPEPAPDD